MDKQDALCNLCGNSLCHYEEHPSGIWKADVPHGLHNAQVDGGYESYHLLDMTRYTFSLCEKCLRQLFNQFKIKPHVHDLHIGYDSDKLTLVPYSESFWEEDQKSYEYRVWKDLGNFHQAYLNKMCNQAVDCPNKAIYTVLISEEFTEDACCEEHKSRWEKCVNAELVKFITNVFKPFL